MHLYFCMQDSTPVDKSNESELSEGLVRTN